MDPDLQPTGYRAPSTTAERTLLALRRYYLGASEKAEVYAAVCAFVAKLRDQHVTPEAALIATKELVAQAAIGRRRTDEQRKLTEEVVRWCIDEYYRAG